MTNPRKAFWERLEVSKGGGGRASSHKSAIPALVRANAGNCKLETLERERGKWRMNVATKGILL